MGKAARGVGRDEPKADPAFASAMHVPDLLDAATFAIGPPYEVFALRAALV
jgi:hypothetical protein